MAHYAHDPNYAVTSLPSLLLSTRALSTGCGRGPVWSAAVWTDTSVKKYPWADSLCPGAVSLVLPTPYRLPTLAPEEQDERAAEALVACQNELGKRTSTVLLAPAEWEPGMVEHRGGDPYRVNSYVDEVNGKEPVRRTNYTCTAVRLGAVDRRINSIETHPDSVPLC